MMNKLFSLKKVIAASLLALSLPLATTALAHDGGPDGRCNKGAHQGFEKSGLPPHLRALQLSDKQKDEIFALMHNQVPAFREQHKERVKLLEELRANSQSDKFDDVKAQQLADKLAALDREKTLTHARNGAKIYAILTPEQRAKAREFKWEKHDRDHDHDGQQPTGFRQHHSEIEPRVM